MDPTEDRRRPHHTSYYILARVADRAAHTVTERLAHTGMPEG